MTTVLPQLEKLENFIYETKFEDLPAAVVHDTKYLLMDSIGVGLAGLSTDPAKMALALARRIGGPPESSIIGPGDKVSCYCAALANGEIIRTIDYCAMTGGGHTPSFIIPPALAMAETTRASGKDLILAMALGFEVAARVANALGGDDIIARSEGPEIAFKSPKRVGRVSATVLGSTTAAGKIDKLDRVKMADALGIASHLGQGRGGVVFMQSPHRTMQKWGIAGWQNTGAMMAVLLADMGYMGDKEIFDPDNNLGYENWQPDNLSKGLGEVWKFDKIYYKFYPCCRALQTAIDCFVNIIEQNNLKPEDIESVKDYNKPDIEFPLFKNKELNSIVDIQYSLPYVLALAAHRIKAGVEWQDWDTVTDPKIVDFTKKVTMQVHPDFGKAWLKDPSTGLAKIEVTAKGRTFTEERPYSRGTPGTEYAMSDKELEAKFRHNASRILTGSKIERAVNTFLELEKLNNISELISHITL
jgi:2-methylcitrate dehydratase PrpD